MSGNLRRNDYIVLSVIVAVFVFIAIFTSVQIIDAKIVQAEDVGAIRLENIKKELQENLTYSADSLEKIADGAQVLIDEHAPMEEIDEYIRAQKAEQILKSDGVNFNAYIAGRGWEIIPDFDKPDDYYATERIWYVGAKDNDGELYISEPYVDRMTGQMCYTMSKMLTDHDTVVAMDFTLSEVQGSISKMMEGGDYTALIVTNDGMIVGYSDMSAVGSKVSDSLPQYRYLVSQVMSSEDHERLTFSVEGSKLTVFSSETDNGWYMILLVNDNALYNKTYTEIAVIIFIYIILLGLTVYLYIYSAEKRIEAEKALDVKSEFLASISDELKDPLNNIIRLSNSDRINNSIDIKDDLESIRESGLMLTQRIDNMLSYSYMISEDKKRRSKKHQDISKTIHKTRAFIIGIFVLTMIFNIIMTTVLGYANATYTLMMDMDTYYLKLNSWGKEQATIVNFFSDVITADPTVLDDYDKCVAWLDSIAGNYSDISVAYVANPYMEHQVIMNNGWVPDEDWHVQDRQWYKDTIKSDSGFSISAPYIDSQTGVYCITFSKVMYGKNQEFIGVFAIDFYLNKLINIFGEGSSTNEYAFLADNEGNIINHPNKKYEMTSVSSVNVADTEYSKLWEGFAYPGFSDYNGKFVTGVCMNDTNTGFTLYIVSNWWDVFGYYVGALIITVLMLTVCIVIVLLMINRIIHWQNNVNEKLAESVKTAAAADKAKSQFLAQMSHEIRTPINAVIGMDEMILRSTDDPLIKEYASNINSAGKTLLELVNGILDFSKIEEGKMEIVPVKYYMVNLVNDLYNLIAEKAVDKGLDLEFDIDPTLPSELFGDDVRLKQIILNLLTNAVKYTQEGSVILRITGVAESEEDYRLYVSVKDSGIGIKPEDMTKLFASFQRLDVERNRNIEGTGLGISIVAELLKMMNSELKVDSIYGKGSEFYFEVMQKVIGKDAIGDYKNAQIVQDNSDIGKIRIENCEILVVDDNDMNLKVAAGLLKLYGVTPDMANSGKESIRMASAKRYDLIFMDHMMPGMDGVETLKEMVKEELVYDTPVICLTANAVTGMRDMYLEAGFNDYLSKPIEMKELESILVKYLPADKIVEDHGTAPGASSKTSGLSPFDLLRSKGFDVESGISYSAGSEEFYIEMLKTFEQGYGEKSEEIRQDFESDDWTNYRIHVHALKSTAKMIGAVNLGDTALAQEMAAKDGRTEEIIDGFMPLMMLYEETVDTIRKAFPPTGENT
ncbi:MAG: response regulator [Clostridiales bacterium]|nr:response regulator [Clostridiales bacterium]